MVLVTFLRNILNFFQIAQRSRHRLSETASSISDLRIRWSNIPTIQSLREPDKRFLRNNFRQNDRPHLINFPNVQWKQADLIIIDKRKWDHWHGIINSNVILWVSSIIWKLIELSRKSRMCLSSREKIYHLMKYLRS